MIKHIEGFDVNLTISYDGNTDVVFKLISVYVRIKNIQELNS